MAAVALTASVALGMHAAGAVGPARAADATVKITDNGYDPTSLTVTAGSVVTWTNTGTSIHTVTSNAGTFDSGDIAAGEAFGNLFDTAGTYPYHDDHNPALITGTVIVTAAAPTPTPNGTPQPTPPPGTLPPDFKTPVPIVTAEPSQTAAPTPVASSVGVGTAAGDSDPLIVGVVAVALIAGVVLYEIWRRRRARNGR